MLKRKTAFYKAFFCSARSIIVCNIIRAYEVDQAFIAHAGFLYSGSETQKLTDEKYTNVLKFTDLSNKTLYHCSNVLSADFIYYENG